MNNEGAGMSDDINERMASLEQRVARIERWIATLEKGVREMVDEDRRRG
ncbi:cell division protein FtsB [Bradyrhizobium sp. USDA 4508]